MLRLIYTSAKTVPANPCFHLAWIESQDAYALVQYGSGKLYHDGTCLSIGGLPPYSGYLSVPGGQCLFDSFSGWYYGVDPVTLQPNYGIAYFHWPGGPGTGAFFDPGQNILLQPWGASLRFYRISDQTLLESVQVLPNKLSIINTICFAGRNRAMAVELASGSLAFFDYMTRKVLLQSAIDPAKAVAFNPKHNLVLAIGTDYRVRLYAREVLPASLSAPEFYPAVAKTRRLQGYPLRTRLLGDQGEACTGYWVHWSLLGEPPKGQLEKEYSPTGEDGYAYNFWFGPYGAGELGDETVKVAVTV